MEKKDIKFSDIISFKKLELDFCNDEHLNVEDVPFRAKFLVRTRKRDYTFFAKDELERDVWIEGLHRLLKSNTDSELLPAEVNGLNVNPDSIGSQVMKAINELGVFNKSEYNKRYIQVKFSDCNNEILFFEGEADDHGAYKKYKFSELVRCRSLDEIDI